MANNTLLSSKAERHRVMFTLARLFYNNSGDTVYYNSLKQLRLHLTRNSLDNIKVKEKPLTCSIYTLDPTVVSDAVYFVYLTHM